ncbi:uncharacterized protein LOC106177500 [Lingula anatina]|uniref:Uncharacterized protein LOC106177500 n=1 Tax=Lingula anatina TaxID=7574 RepID=A0A1S3JZM8_LINAN|nr:uncharacterized protein LOC106177500 [Lingula anatina]|eukprot:XP_013415742.1 uncharacterized protein LOC106177500 [Lingula anatina]
MVKWFRLKCPCPVTGCPNSQGRLLEWVCARDNDAMYINENGILACTHDKHVDKIINWKFDCGDRRGPHKYEHYQSPDYEGFTHAMAMALPHMGEAGADWVLSLVNAVRIQYGK